MTPPTFLALLRRALLRAHRPTAAGFVGTCAAVTRTPRRLGMLLGELTADKRGSLSPWWQGEIAARIEKGRAA